MKNGARKTFRTKGRKPLWPLLVALGGLILVSAGLWAVRGGVPALSGQEGGGTARLQVDREEINLGDVRLGEWVSASFELTNVGSQALRFQEKPYIEVRAGC